MIIEAFYHLLKPALFRIDPEHAHDRIIALLSLVSRHETALSTLQIAAPRFNQRMAMTAFGISFPSPLGIAAGLDKNAVAFPALLALGFGHVEVGTITPRQQDGQPRPRVFRLVEDQALINRMGFPGQGVAAVVQSLATHKRPHMIVGCNIGPNKRSVESGAAVEDLVAGYRAVAAAASYVAINISSPNTENLRNLQQKSSLRAMLAAINNERQTLLHRPLLIKISPDLSDQELFDLIEVAVEARIDGLMSTNTTISRPDTLRSPQRRQQGGLSGFPLAPIAARVVRRIAIETNGTMPIIAAGGIQTGADIIAAISLGATLTQTYSGFIYRGPGMARQIAHEIDQELNRLGVSSLAELRMSAI